MPTMLFHCAILVSAAARRVELLVPPAMFFHGALMRKPMSSGMAVRLARLCVQAVASRRIDFLGLCLYASHIAPARKPAVQPAPSVVVQAPLVPAAPLPFV